MWTVPQQWTVAKLAVLSQKPIHLIRWHPAGGFACVLSSKGELQAFDLGLNSLQFLLNAEEPSPTLILGLDRHIL